MIRCASPVFSETLPRRRKSVASTEPISRPLALSYTLSSAIPLGTFGSFTCTNSLMVYHRCFSSPAKLRIGICAPNSPAALSCPYMYRAKVGPISGLIPATCNRLLICGCEFSSLSQIHLTLHSSGDGGCPPAGDVPSCREISPCIFPVIYGYLVDM